MKPANIRKGSNHEEKSATVERSFAAALLCAGLMCTAAAVAAPQDMPSQEPRSRINPDYPAAALSQLAEGWVHLRFSIDAEGAVYDAEVVKSCAGPAGEQCILNVPLFSESALKAIQGWRYDPSPDGLPRTGVETIIRFQLQQ